MSQAGTLNPETLLHGSGHICALTAVIGLRFWAVRDARVERLEPYNGPQGRQPELEVSAFVSRGSGLG